MLSGWPGDVKNRLSIYHMINVAGYLKLNLTRTKYRILTWKGNIILLHIIIL